MEKKFMYPYKGHRLTILYQAYMWDGKYRGASYKPIGKKTTEYIGNLSDDEYEKFWEEIDILTKKFNFPL